MNSQKVKVKQFILPDKESYTPVLLNFQNGILNKNTVNSVDYFEAVKNKTKERIAVLTTPNGNIYNGKIENCTSSNDLINTFLAIKNRKTNKVRIIQIEQASMINNIYNEKNLEESITNGNLNENENSLKYQMLKNFGGRKAIRAIERTERMKVNVDIVREQLNKTIETSEITGNDDSLQHVEDNIEAIRPPMNKEAKSVEDVYSITDIIPKDLLDKLNDECYMILETDLESIPIKSEFILNQIKKIKEYRNPITDQNLLDLKILLYMDGLKNLIKSRQRIMSKIELSKVTEKLENHIRENFSDPNLKTRTKSRFSSDKALCYFITLALLLNRDYEIGISVLAQELSIPKVKILKYARIINSQTKASTDILRLQLPGKIKTKMFLQNRRSK